MKEEIKYILPTFVSHASLSPLLSNADLISVKNIFLFGIQKNLMIQVVSSRNSFILAL